MNKLILLAIVLTAGLIMLVSEFYLRKNHASLAVLLKTKSGDQHQKFEDDEAYRQRIIKEFGEGTKVEVKVEGDTRTSTITYPPAKVIIGGQLEKN